VIGFIGNELVAMMQIRVGRQVGVAIVFITRDAVVTMWYRLMDAVDPKLVDQAEKSIRSHADVRSVERLRMRWVGHGLHLDADVSLDGHLTMMG
jgi:divalent metal cation (Fe/Co/Zn/Cd) transporter